jgi:hypothetical protein
VIGSGESAASCGVTLTDAFTHFDGAREVARDAGHNPADACQWRLAERLALWFQSQLIETTV